MYNIAIFLFLLFPKQCGHIEEFLRQQLRPGVQSSWYRKRTAFSL